MKNYQDQGKGVISVSNGYFGAGAVFDGNGKIIRAAPVLKYSLGKSKDWLVRYAQYKGWTVVVLYDK